MLSSVFPVIKDPTTPQMCSYTTLQISVSEKLSVVFQNDKVTTKTCWLTFWDTPYVHVV